MSSSRGVLTTVSVQTSLLGRPQKRKRISKEITSICLTVAIRKYFMTTKQTLSSEPNSTTSSKALLPSVASFLINNGLMTSLSNPSSIPRELPIRSSKSSCSNWLCSSGRAEGPDFHYSLLLYLFGCCGLRMKVNS